MPVLVIRKSPIIRTKLAFINFTFSVILFKRINSILLFQWKRIQRQ